MRHKCKFAVEHMSADYNNNGFMAPPRTLQGHMVPEDKTIN